MLPCRSCRKKREPVGPGKRRTRTADHRMWLPAAIPGSSTVCATGSRCSGRRAISGGSVTRSSQDQHGVAEAVKAVPLLHRLAVCVEYAFPTGKGTDQHQQGGARQMKVRNQPVNRSEPISRVDECG